MFGGNKTLEVSTSGATQRRRRSRRRRRSALAGPDAPADGDAAEGWEAGGRAAADGGAEATATRRTGTATTTPTS